MIIKDISICANCNVWDEVKGEKYLKFAEEVSIQNTRQTKNYSNWFGFSGSMFAMMLKQKKQDFLTKRILLGVVLEHTIMEDILLLLGLDILLVRK